MMTRFVRLKLGGPRMQVTYEEGPHGDGPHLALGKLLTCVWFDHNLHLQTASIFESDVEDALEYAAPSLAHALAPNLSATCTHGGNKFGCLVCSPSKE